MSDRLMSAEQLSALDPYTPVIGYARGGLVVCLAHRSPNGIWWSTVANPIDLDQLVHIFDEGFEVLYTNSQLAQGEATKEQALSAVDELEFFARIAARSTAPDDQQQVRESARMIRDYVIHTNASD